MDKNIGLVAVLGEQTNLVKAVKSKDSLRTTLPMFCVRQWNLKPGDRLDWSIETVKGETGIFVRIIKD